jgi:2-polyprenyl-6-methoxyphenol hydroxylase-like FAD-dependent oxidoreductase
LTQGTEVPVLVVGGGPVGLTLAMELGWRRVPCLLLNDQPETARHPKANAVGARSMEHFRRLGVAGRLRRAGLPPQYPTDVAYLTRLAGHELARLPLPSSAEASANAAAGRGPWPTPEPPHRVSQIYLEAILKEHAGSFAGVTLRYGWRLESFCQREGHVVAEAVESATGRRETIRAGYLVACDGARSRVRKELGIELEGESGVVRPFMGGTMLAVYFRARSPRGWLRASPAWMYWIINPEIRAVFISIDGDERFLFHTQIPAGREPASLDAPRLIHAAAGATFPVEILSSLPWMAGYSLVAERYRSGRVFLAGDAVHLFTPTGGLGMNTGVDDAVNLGWKLAAVHQGWGAPSLLESYGAERRPIAFRNVSFARSFATSVGTVPVSPRIELPGEEAASERERLGQRLLDHACREFIIPGIWLGLRYESSPIIWPDETVAPPDDPGVYAPSARPGSRAPHIMRADGTVLFDHFGKEFTLLRLGSEADPSSLERAAARRGVPLKVLEVPEPEARALYERELVLVRPDQHVAWRGDRAPDDPLAVIDRVRGASPP